MPRIRVAKECPTCQKYFKQLASHLRTHRGEKPHKCEHCDQAFIQKCNLVSHLRVHSKQKPFRCTECNAAFSQGSNLRTHERIHSGEKPFQCPWCPKAFKDGGSLDVHKRTHTGEKPYICLQCDKGFAAWAGWRNHMYIHSGERPFKCPECDDAFTRSSHLAIHRRIHSDEKPFVCTFPMCDYAARAKHNLQSHHRPCHSEEAQRRQKKEEERIARCLTAHGIPFKREHQIQLTCLDSTFARVDFVIDIKGGIIFLEVDEGQHEHYGVACDIKRMLDIHGALDCEGNSLPLLFIRYNPHAFSVDGVTSKVSSKDRQDRLVGIIRDWVAPVPGSLQIQYMYYDCRSLDGSLQTCIWQDNEFHPYLLACCSDPIT